MASDRARMNRETGVVSIAREPSALLGGGNAGQGSTGGGDGGSKTRTTFADPGDDDEPEQDAQAVGDAANSAALAQTVNAEAAAVIRSQSIRQRGPVLTGAMDRQTEAVFFGQNTGVPSPLHPELAGALGRFTGAAAPGKGIPGTHAEFNAINAGLFARPGSTISDFVFYSVRLRGTGQGEQILMCSNCSRILTGAEDLLP